MAPPWTTLAVTAAVLLVRFAPEYSIKRSYLWTTSGFIALSVLWQFIYRCILYPEYFSPLRHIPAPKRRSWIKGNSTSMGLEYDRAREWTRTIPNNGLIRYYMAANIERVLVVGQEALSEILVSKVYDFPKSESLRIKLLRFTGNGILLAEGDEHRMQRRGLLPSFAFRNIKNLYPVFWTKAVEMADALETQMSSGSKDTVVQISDWAGRVTLDIVGLAAMGRDFDAVRDPHAEFHKKYDKLRMKPTTFTRLMILFSMLTVGFKAYFALPTKWNRESKESADYIRRYARQIVEDTKKEKGESSAQRKDIASLAMASGVFSDENMVDQMITFLVAGHETIAASLQWAVYALCKHPDMQTRLREEIRVHLSTSSESTVTAADIDSLPYLNAFCNEVLRYYPPVPSTVREARVDTSLAGTFIPKGTTLLILAGATNLDKARWGPDAEEFNPDRWLGEGRANSGGSDSNYANLTFLAGPRGCIGNSFARSELLCLVAVMVGRFRMELKDPKKELEIVRAISAAPKDGAVVRLTRMEG